MIFGHGGNKEQLAQTIGCSVDDIIDMSSNLNPLGPPERIERAIVNNLNKIRSLPHPDAISMRQGFARFHGIDPDQVVAGNGTTWFIYTLPKALGAKTALIAGPTYSDYKDACDMHGIKTAHCFSRPDDSFQMDIDRLSQNVKNTDLVFLCNPNNPTGTLLSREKILWLLKRHPDTFFLVDESYLPFVDQAETCSMVSSMENDNCVVLSSMSKIFRIPGLRTGFLSGSTSVCERIMEYYQPWSVNALAQAVITDIFENQEDIAVFYQKTRDYIQIEKQMFLDQIQHVKGLFCYPTTTYFILAELKQGMGSRSFCDRIGRERVLIRDCSNFSGLNDSFVRFSLKDRDQNTLLSDLIKKAMADV